MRRFLVLGIWAIALASFPVGPAAAGGFCVEDPITDEKTAMVDMKDNCFFPTIVRVSPGDSVTWVNRDAGAHTITAPGLWGGGHTEYFRGDRVSFRFENEGIFPYVCLVHPGMVGAVVVGDGEGQGTASDGSFAQPGVNSGRAADGDAGDKGDHRVGLFVAAGGAITALVMLVILFTQMRRRAVRPVTPS